MTTNNETPTAPEYQNSKPGEARNAAYALPVADAAEAIGTVELINRLQDAIEGECDGLAIDEDQARAILEHIFANPLPKASIEPGAVEALRNLVTAWEATKSGKTSVREIQRWLVEDMKPAIDAARRALAASHADGDQK